MCPCIHAANVRSLLLHWPVLAAQAWGLVCAIEARIRWHGEGDQLVREGCVGDLVLLSEPEPDGRSLMAIAARTGRLVRRPSPVGVDPRHAVHALGSTPRRGRRPGRRPARSCRCAADRQCTPEVGCRALVSRPLFSGTCSS